MDDLEFRLKAATRLAAVQKAKNSLLTYQQLLMPDPNDPDDVTKSQYTLTPQARVLAEVLERVERRDPKYLRVAVSIGPQFGKSQLISRAAPAWFSGRNPAINMILGSYNQDFANEFGDDVRAIVNSPAHKQVFPEHEMRRGGESKDLLITTKGGKQAFVGVGGSGTGKAADVFIVDDPIRNDDDAQSETFRDRMWRWFLRVANTRIHNESAVVVVHCLAGDTLVTMADGQRRRIRHLRRGDFVLAWERGEWRPRKVLNWADQGEDDVFVVRTGNSRVVGNSRHPFLVDRGESFEWVKLADLKVGDKVVQSGAEPAPAEARVSLEEAWLLGFMFGDGWLTRRDSKNWDKVRRKHYPRRGWVTCYAEGVRESENVKVFDVFGRVFGVEPKRTKFGYRRVDVQRVGRWFAAHGLVGKAKTKRLPAWLFSQPLGIKRAFLDGLVLADGCTTNPSAYRRVGLANQLLVEDVRSLARSAGLRPTNVHCCEQTVQPPNAPEPIESRIYKVSWSARVRDDAFYTLAVRSIEPAGREKVYDVQVEGAESFIADGMVVHNTRWHEDDLIGRLCDPDHPERNKAYAGIADEWTYINLPAVVDDEKLAKALGLALEPQTDPIVLAQFGDKPMTSLWPERFSLPFLAKQKRLDKRGFEALRMGRPSPEDGDFFKADNMVEYYPDDLPKNLKIFGASDHAVSKKQRADSTVIGCVGIDEDDDIWVLPDLTWDKLETDQTVEALLEKFKLHKPLLWWMESEMISKSFGPFLQKRMREERTYVSIDPVTPAADKMTRARAIQGRMQMRKVRFPAYAAWWPAAKAQMLKFPFGTHDDFVDWLAHIGLGLNKGIAAERVSQKSDKMPTPGTIAWTLGQTRAKERREKQLANQRGW